MPDKLNNNASNGTYPCTYNNNHAQLLHLMQLRHSKLNFHIEPPSPYNYYYILCLSNRALTLRGIGRGLHTRPNRVDLCHSALRRTQPSRRYPGPPTTCTDQARRSRSGPLSSSHPCEQSGSSSAAWTCYNWLKVEETFATSRSRPDTYVHTHETRVAPRPTCLFILRMRGTQFKMAHFVKFMSV